MVVQLQHTYTENLWQALIRQDFVKMVPKTTNFPIDKF